MQAQRLRNSDHCKAAAYQSEHGSTHGGNDTLVAGTATAGSTVVNDMWGDAQFMSASATAGRDTFVFKDNLAAGQTVGMHNTIEDFNQSQHDVIEFIGVAGVSSFGDLGILVQAGATIITAGTDQVTLNNFTGTLTANDFLFAPA